MASDLDPALIEAVAKDIYTEWDRQLFERRVIPFRLPWDMAEQVAKERYQLSAVAAIRAVDAHRAASVRAAVRDMLCDFQAALMASALGSSEAAERDDRYEAAKAALLALVGAEETE